jgi:hypothetical protein
LQSKSIPPRKEGPFNLLMRAYSTCNAAYLRAQRNQFYVVQLLADVCGILRCCAQSCWESAVRRHDWIARFTLRGRVQPAKTSPRNSIGAKPATPRNLIVACRDYPHSDAHPVHISLLLTLRSREARRRNFRECTISFRRGGFQLVTERIRAPRDRQI